MTMARLLAVLSLISLVWEPSGAFHCNARTFHRKSIAIEPSSTSTRRFVPNVGDPCRAGDLVPSTSLGSSASSSNELDTDALSKYALAAVTQLSLFAGTFKLLDVGIASAGIDPSAIPFPAVAFLFYAIALKSRTFNPLNNQRPDRTQAVEGKGSAGFKDRVMPSWTPPGVVFPIMWVLIIGPIRAYSSGLVFEETGTFFNPALLSLMLHLTCGDVWNTINNTEKRYGASVVGVMFVVASVAFAANQYYEVNPLAGQLLGGTAIWLCTATALIADTWRLNPRPSGEREPLYPVVGEAETEFAWFSPK
mmetsp:Transcript_27823/g.81658  ORF Transcript_27823/g.81658 Transcript_27823/m.81658 type:complete len:307 (-) Transcript_27823:1346-2266(-)